MDEDDEDDERGRGTFNKRAVNYYKTEDSRLRRAISRLSLYVAGACLCTTATARGTREKRKPLR